MLIWNHILKKNTNNKQQQKKASEKLRLLPFIPYTAGHVIITRGFSSRVGCSLRQAIRILLLVSSFQVLLQYYMIWACYPGLYTLRIIDYLIFSQTWLSVNAYPVDTCYTDNAGQDDRTTYNMCLPQPVFSHQTQIVTAHDVLYFYRLIFLQACMLQKFVGKKVIKLLSNHLTIFMSRTIQLSKII